MKSSFEQFLSQKKLDPDQLKELSWRLKKEGKKVGTLNGSFDLLHPGHLEMIYEASCQSDALIVLLNTDASIRRNKGQRRPINSLDVRLLHIAAIEMVDFVSWFHQDDPRDLLGEIAPNVHSNGSEYGPNCIEAEVVKKGGGKIHVIDLIEGYSTTNLIKKIQTCV